MTAEPIAIDPDVFYDENTALLRLGIYPDVFSRERKAGRLRSVKVGSRRHLYRGAWIIDWLESTASPERNTHQYIKPPGGQIPEGSMV